MNTHTAATVTGPTTAAAPMGALAGFRILDLTTVLLGPYATQILADYGADVIKIEPLEGDPVRPNGSFRHPDKASLYLAVNRNKRAIAINLKSAEGRDLLWKLIEGADVLVHNLRPSSIKGLGFTYAEVSKRNPRLVYCFSTGFGSNGPDAEKPAYDDIIQSGSGIAALNGQASGKPDYVPTVMADKTAGLMLSQAIVAALLARERTGRGQSVEVPMLEALVSFMMVEHLGGLTFEPPVAPAGYTRLMAGGRQPAPTKDGYMTVLPYTGRHWNAFLTAAGRTDLIEKYEVNDPVRLYANVKTLYGELREITKGRTTAEWMKVCQDVDIPASPMYTLDELPEHPQLKAVGLFKTMEHPTEGTIRYVDSPVRFSDTPASVRSGAPSIGQHTDEILREAGYSDVQVAGYRTRRTVA